MFRDEVTVQDAVVAVTVMESSMQVVVSVLSVMYLLIVGCPSTQSLMQKFHFQY